MINDLFDGFEFQTLAIELLAASIEKNHLAPAYLFAGPEGVGQKEIALGFFEGILSKSSKLKNIHSRLKSGNHPDLLYIEPTYLYQGKLITQSIAKKEELKNQVKPQIRLEQIKNLTDFIHKKPIESELSMVLLEDADRLNESASNALLKTIEEPTNGILILVSSRPERLLTTIKSRCQKIPFNGFSRKILQERLNKYDLNERFNENQDELITLANGSPNLLINNIKNLESITEIIWSKISNQPQNALEALILAKEITDELNPDEQMILISWMQQIYWSKEFNAETTRKLEKLKSHLKSYINQRTAWEVALIGLI